MQKSLFAKQTKERLQTYNLFSDDTVRHVVDFAKKQRQFETYQDFFRSVGIPEPTMFIDEKRRGISYVDIPAREKEKGVIVYHLPMANPLDANQLYQVATIAGIMSQYRVIAFGNPAGRPYRFRWQSLRFIDRLRIALTSNRQPLVAAEIAYLQSQNISNMHQVGYSFGSLKALIESSYLPIGSVHSVIAIEPVAHPRYPQQLAGDFQRTIKPLGDYVNRTNLPTFFAAREDSAKAAKYTAGLLRPVNLAIGYMLSRVDFMVLLRQVRERQPGADIGVAWAEKSELGNDAHFTTTLDDMARHDPHLRGFRLTDDYHAVANDIHLLSAIIYEQLHKT